MDRSLKKVIRILVFILFFMGILWVVLFTPVDRSPYQESSFYQEMVIRLDSLDSAFEKSPSHDSLHIGWSKVSITPLDNMSLAGYSNRNPKLMEGVHDSIFVRSVIFSLGEQKVALVSADLLIIHPEVTRKIYASLPSHWKNNQLFLTATHSHSSLGGWAPGLIGEAIAGFEDDTVAQFIANQVIKSLKMAEGNLELGSLGVVESNLEQLVYNRLVHERGSTDPWLKSILINKGDEIGIMNFFSAHATCLNSQWHTLSGDFPGRLNQLITSDSIYDFSLYGAGAVGSMGPVAPGEGWERVEKYSRQLSKQMQFLPMIAGYQNISSIKSFRLSLPLRDPFVKVTENWAVRPYLFKKLAGDHKVSISVLKLGSTVFVGVPADFSGELALTLYQKARDLGLNLIITSFNGGYIGYVVKDEWYDLNKYESRSMSWYGPDNGSYLSEVIERILQIVA